MAAILKKPIDPSWAWELLVFNHQAEEVRKKARASMKQTGKKKGGNSK